MSATEQRPINDKELPIKDNKTNTKRNPATIKETDREEDRGINWFISSRLCHIGAFKKYLENTELIYG